MKRVPTMRLSGGEVAASYARNRTMTRNKDAAIFLTSFLDVDVGSEETPPPPSDDDDGAPSSS